ADPQVKARRMVTEVPHSRLGPVETLGAPVKFSATPASLTRGAPLLGEHTREVLREAGYSDREAENLEAEGAVLISRRECKG
ncbi:MAG: CoA transferase, partial [Acidobacteriota bacterium]|nr:CoA transferase [Acidobacteriota bacterium]